MRLEKNISISCHNLALCHKGFCGMCTVGDLFNNKYTECIDAEKGILRSLNERGHVIYLLSCDVCDTKIVRGSYSKTRIYLCQKCMAKVRQQYKYKDGEKKSRADTRFEKAVAELEKHTKRGTFGEYAKAIKAASTKKEKYGSVPEAMVAIELLKLGYKIIPQQVAGRYKVDFAIPEQKYIIEVDGTVYHKEIDNDREAMVQLYFGLDWLIIHVPAEWIRKNIHKLKVVIDKSVKNREIEQRR